MKRDEAKVLEKLTERKTQHEGDYFNRQRCQHTVSESGLENYLAEGNKLVATLSSGNM